MEQKKERFVSHFVWRDISIDPRPELYFAHMQMNRNVVEIESKHTRYVTVLSRLHKKTADTCNQKSFSSSKSYQNAISRYFEKVELRRDNIYDYLSSRQLGLKIPHYVYYIQAFAYRH